MVFGRTIKVEFRTMIWKRVSVVPLVVCLIVACSCTKWGATKHPNWSQATSGEHLANLFWNDVKSKNWHDAEAHIGGEFIGMSPGRTMDKPALLEHIRKFDLKAFQIGEVETRSAGKDLIVVYKITATGTLDGKPLPQTPFRMMSVWQEQSHGWVLVAHTAVPAAE